MFLSMPAMTAEFWELSEIRQRSFCRANDEGCEVWTLEKFSRDFAAAAL